MGQINTATITTGTIVNSDIAAGAGVSASKLQHETAIFTNFDLLSTSTPVAKRIPIFIAPSACTVVDVRACLVDSGTTTDVDFDLLKGGSSILTATINIVHGTGDRTAVAGTISSAALVKGDVLEADLAVTSSTGALGPILQVLIDHDAV